MDASVVINCKIRRIMYVYLHLMIEGNPHRHVCGYV
jgi:hypothetical protein